MSPLRHSAENLPNVEAGAFAGLVAGADIQNCAVLSGSIEVGNLEFCGGFIGEAWGEEYLQPGRVAALSSPTVLKNLSCRVGITVTGECFAVGGFWAVFGLLWPFSRKTAIP